MMQGTPRYSSTPKVESSEKSLTFGNLPLMSWAWFHFLGVSAKQSYFDFPDFAFAAANKDAGVEAYGAASEE